MKKLWLVSGALLVGLGVVSTNLWLELRAERQVNAELQTQLAEPASSPSRTAAVAQLPAVASAAKAPETCVAATTPPTRQLDSEITMRATAAVSVAAAAAAAGLTGSGEQDLMNDPEYRKAQLTVTRLKLAQSNPGFAEALGISAKEADQLFEVMAEQQLKLSAELTSATAGGVDSKAMETVLQRARTRVDPLRATLGEARYAQYQDYQMNVRPALTQVSSMGSALNAAGQPLNESQSRGLASVLLAEQQRQKQEAALPRANINPGVPRNIADSLEESARRQEEGNRRILEASAAYLNAAQQEVLKTRYEQQAAQRRRTIESAREMDARRQSLPAQPTPSVTPP